MINRILEQLEEEREYSYADFEEYCNETDADLDAEYDDLFHRGLERAKKIVRQVAKEYGQLPVVKEILTTEKDGGWIPVGQRLPEKSGKYIVTQERYRIDDRTHIRPIAIETDYVEFNAVYKEWQRAKFFNIIAWMELPAPYQTRNTEEQKGE